MGKTYLIIHLIPLLLFKRKELRNKPIRTIYNFLKGYLRSMSFILWFVFFGTKGLCDMKKFNNPEHTGILYRILLFFPNFSTALCFSLMSGFASTGVLFEAPNRRLELAQYMFPRILEGHITFLRKRHYIPAKIPLGSVSIKIIKF